MLRICRSRLHGLGLFTNRHVLKGDQVCKLDVHYGSRVPAFDDYYGRFINHSCMPSCKLYGYCLHAQCDLQPGDEITLDYTTMNISIPIHKSYDD